MLGCTTSFLHVDETTLRKFQDQLYPAIAEKGFLHLPEFKMRRKDGTVFPTEHSVIPLEDEQGKPIGWVSVVSDNGKRKLAEEALREKTRELGERVKELSCLYGLSHLVEKPDISLEEIFQGTVDLIPPSLRYPEIACARLILEDQTFTTNDFNETVRKQTSEIIVHGEQIGTLEVCYLKEKLERDQGLFLKEVRNLINAIVE